MTDGPFAETKEQLGGFWVIRCDDLDQALAWAEKCAAACMAPVEVRPFDDEPTETGPEWTLASVYRAEYGRCVATLARLLGDIGLAEEAVQDAFAVAVQKWDEIAAAQPGRLDRDHRPQPGHRPAAPGVDPRGPARPGAAAAPTRRAHGRWDRCATTSSA